MAQHNGERILHPEGRVAASRHREFRADAGAASLMGRKQPMINALQRLGGMQAGTLPKTMAAMGIAGGLGSLFATHPPLEERVQRLRNS